MADEGGTTKKKLRVLGSEPQKTVLPEVLPDPRRPSSPNAPRARTLAHMKTLLAVSASAAAMACASGGTKDRGYAVVDPMPNPRQPCFDPLEKIIVHAAWTTDTDGGTPAVRIRLEIKQEATTELSFAKAQAYSSYGTFVSQHTTEKEFVADVLPAANATSLSIHVSGLPCDDPGKTSNLNVSVDTDGPKDGSKLKATLSIPPY